MAKSKNYEKNLTLLAKLSRRQLDDLDAIERDAIARFEGSVDELESAIGMLRIGHHFGWRTLVLIHDKKTVRKYEEILGIKLRDYFPEVGPSAERNRGYKLAMKLENFWKAVSGDIKIPDRRKIEK